MELKVWVEGIQRIVCGVSESTTCQDVVFALAHATGKTGRFTLIERWRNNERLLAPLEQPLKILLKWGEYSNDVQFILQRSSVESNLFESSSQNKKSEISTKCTQSAAHVYRDRDIKKSLTFSGGHGDTACSKKAEGHTVVNNYSSNLCSKGKENNFFVKNEKQSERVIVDDKYKDLVYLVNKQRDTLSNQQVEITKYEAEIAYLEGRLKEDENRLNYLSSEIKHLQDLADKTVVETSGKNHLIEELMKAKHEEELVKSEINSFQAKLTDCESKLQKCQSEIKSLELELCSQDSVKKSEEESKSQQEIVVKEMEKLQSAIVQANDQAENAYSASLHLTNEVEEWESAINEKKKTLEELKQQMKEANLLALSMAQPDENRIVADGKIGSNRRFVGSPRQLENAVPTFKNPHGVWV